MRLSDDVHFRAHKPEQGQSVETYLQETENYSSMQMFLYGSPISTNPRKGSNSSED
jgi:hypothetical protein